MAGVTITGGVDLIAIDLQDKSPLAKANLTHLASTAKGSLDSFKLPIDECGVHSMSLGGTFNQPNLLSADLPSLTICPGTNCVLSVKTQEDKTLFPKDSFSPEITLEAGQSWVGFEVDVTCKASLAETVNGLGASLAVSSTIASCTWTLFTGSPLPSLLTAVEGTLNNFALTTSAEAIRRQPLNTVNTTEMKGSITVGVSIQQPFTLNPLASASLPFNQAVSIEPTVTLRLGTSVEVAGDLLLRCYKVTADLLTIGVYKKQGSTLSVGLTTGAGLEGNVGSDDVLSAILNAALPGIDVAAAGISGSEANELNAVMKTGLCRNLSAQMNATCSAGSTDEAAVLYEVRLNEGDAATTDRALQNAIQGSWTELEILPNTKCLRNMAVETIEKKRSITLNLFGAYSATSLTSYLRTCTILVDDSGQISLIDKLNAKRISAANSPYASDTAKLRQALVEDFLCTATYTVVSGKPQLNLTALQSYLDYGHNMSHGEMRQNACLGYALGVMPPSAVGSLLTGARSFKQAAVSANIRYDEQALLRIFYKDPLTALERSRPEIESEGRKVMALFLDQGDDTDAARLKILRNDEVWNQMGELGSPAAFRTIPALNQLRDTEFKAVSGDWISVDWWAKSLVAVVPALSKIMATVEQSTTEDFTHDHDFMEARTILAGKLASVIENTNAAFVRGWGAAVMFAMSGESGQAELDLAWDTKTLHFGHVSPATVEV